MSKGPRQCAEYIGKAARLMIRCGRLEDAAKALKREMKYYAECEGYEKINKVIMGMVLIHLHNEDYVAADQFFKSSLGLGSFGSSEEAGALEDLLTAYDSGDDETGRRTLNLPVFKYLDNAFAKLARDLVIPGGVATSRSAYIDDNNSLPSPEEEFPDDDLC